MPTIKGLIVKDGKITDGSGKPIEKYLPIKEVKPEKSSEPDETWTKEELIEYAHEHGIQANQKMRKADILANIKEAM